MPKQFMRGVMRRGHQAVSSPQIQRIFGSRLKNPNLWHLNRHSVSWAFAIGLFMSFMPFPSQMVVSAAIAVAVGCNLPIAVATVWISNPVTIPPIFYGCYVFGTWVLGEPAQDVSFELSFDYLVTKIADIWQPLVLGCVSIGLLSAVIGFFGLRWLWRFRVAQSWKERKQRRLKRAPSAQLRN